MLVFLNEHLKMALALLFSTKLILSVFSTKLILIHVTSAFEKLRIAVLIKLILSIALIRLWTF